MSPYEMALLHLRLQQVGDVLAALANHAVADARVWDQIDDIKCGMNPPPPPLQHGRVTIIRGAGGNDVE